MAEVETTNVDAVASFTALEELAFAAPTKLIRADRDAYEHLTVGQQLTDDAHELIRLARELPVTSQKRYIHNLKLKSLLSLSALTCQAIFHDNRNAHFLAECAATLHYLGLTNNASDSIIEAGLYSKDHSILQILAGIFADEGAFSEIRKLVAASSIETSRREQVSLFLAKSESSIKALQASGGKLNASTYIINLPQDRYRRISMTARLNKIGVPHTFVNATRIDDVPEDFWPLLRVDPLNLKDGSFGNQISQYRAWKKISEGTTEHGIILEDDAFVKSQAITTFDYGSICADYDIIFINDRMSSGLSEGAREPVVIPIEVALSLKSRLAPELNALGSDAYVITRTGARKLLEIAESEGFHSVGTDWYIVSHSFDYGLLGQLNPHSVIYKVLRSRQDSNASIRLSGGVLTPPFAEHRPLGIWRDTRIM